MRYESNPKHGEPWQQGARGTLCPKEIDQATARRLLMESELEGSKRYAVHEGRAYCAQQHGEDVWHGYPVGWRKVPEKLTQVAKRGTCGQKGQRSILGLRKCLP